MWEVLNGGYSVPVARMAALVSLAFTATAYRVLVHGLWQDAGSARRGDVERAAEGSAFHGDGASFAA
jgi:hypothetical protein